MVSPLHGIDLAKAILGLIGALSSALGSGLICICYIFLLPVREHFRHKMILNLAVADFVNHASIVPNLIYLLATGNSFPAGPRCNTAGFFIQFGVQAVDCSMMATAMVTVFAITRPGTFEDWSTRKTALCIAAIWVMPATTALTAAFKKLYAPASGGWCWLSAKPVYLRYVMTHAWRFLFIFLIFIAYVYLYFFLRSHFKDLASVSRGSFANSQKGTTGFRRKMSAASAKFTRSADKPESQQEDEVALKEMVPKSDSYAQSAQFPSDPGAFPERPGEVTKPKKVVVSAGSKHHGGKVGRNVDYEQRLAKIRKVLLMRAYPTWFVVLWIPGLANRLVEASGNKSPAWLVLLQTSTQYIGLANAIAYGWNEGVLKELQRRYDQHRRRKTQRWGSERVV